MDTYISSFSKKVFTDRNLCFLFTVAGCIYAYDYYSTKEHKKENDEKVVDAMKKTELIQIQNQSNLQLLGPSVSANKLETAIYNVYNDVDQKAIISMNYNVRDEYDCASLLYKNQPFANCYQFIRFNQKQIDRTGHFSLCILFSEYNPKKITTEYIQKYNIQSSDMGKKK